MGTPEFAVPSLRKIAASRHRIVGVVTQPDRPRGRGQKLQPTAVKQAALDMNLKPILQPLKHKDPRFLKELSALEADLFVVVAYRILPEVVFTMPPLGTINLHPSLLPRYRGPAPIQWSLINGDRETGITIIRINRDVDAGEILLQKKVPILPDETAGSLHDRLADMGADGLVETIDLLAQGKVMPIPQDSARATPAPKITKEIRHVSFARPAEQVKNLIHGLSPYPAAFATYKGELLKFYRARVVDSQSREAMPGTILRASGGHIYIACQPGIVEILELQKQGKKRLHSDAFLRGYRLIEGERLL